MKRLFLRSFGPSANAAASAVACKGLFRIAENIGPILKHGIMLHIAILATTLVVDVHPVFSLPLP